MKSNRRNLVTLAAGVLLVALAFVGAALLGTGRGSGTGAPSGVDVIGAARAIGTGHVISAADLSVVHVDIPPTGAVTTRDAAVGKVARLDITQGKPITDAMLAAPAPVAGAKLYFTLPSGEVALNVPTGDISPYVQPGDEIDIIATPHPAGATAPGTTRTKIALKGIRVLAVGTPGTPSAGNLVIAVTPTEAEAVEFIVKNTDFTYVLRSPLDFAKPEQSTSGMDLDTFKRAYGY